MLLTLEEVHLSRWRGPRPLPVLRDVTLELAAGESVGIYGQRGAGKSTLLRVAAGFCGVDSGRVLVDGADLSQMSRRARARLLRTTLAWVDHTAPQSGELPARAFVALPLYRETGPRQAQHRALTALERVGASDCADERWANLSDTERTLVAIAQGLVREPKLLLVDDPTARLDLIDRERVGGLLRAAAHDGGCGVLMTGAELAAMRHADRVLTLSRGRLLAAAERESGRGGAVVEFPRDVRSA